MTISLHPLTPRTRLNTTGREVTVAGDATTGQSVHTTWHSIHTVCTYCFKTHAIHENMHKRTYVCTYTALSLSHLNRSPHTLITSTYKNHSFTPLSSLHFHPSHSTHHLTPHPSHFTPHTPSLTSLYLTSPLIPHPSHFTPHTPSLTPPLTLHPSHTIPHFSLPHLIPHPLLSLSP